MGLIIDVSSNNGHPIDYSKAVASGVVAVFVKATEGTGYTNPNYATDVAGFAAAGVPVLAYHYADFGNAAAEAAHFRAVAGARARVLDSETSTNAAWQDEFLAALNVPAGEELDYGSASTLPRGVRALLWPASYGKAPGFGDVWQFTDAQIVPGIPGKVDASQWIGPQADFDALFSIIPAPIPPPPAPAPKPYPISFGGKPMTVIPVAMFKTDANGWTAQGVALPAGKTNADIVSIECDAASGFDPQGWHFCWGAPDFRTTGQIVFKSVAPNDSFTARVYVAD